MTKFITVALLFALTLCLRAGPIPYEEISLLLRMHETNSFITQQITQRRLLHALTPQQEVQLRSEGAPDALIQALRNPNVRLSDAEAIAFVARREQQQKAIQEAAATQVAAIAQAAAIPKTTARPILPEPYTPPTLISANNNGPVTSRPRAAGFPITAPETSSFTGYPTATYNNTTTIRPDYLGGSRVTKGFDNTTRIQPDYLGGFRASDSEGNTTRYRSDLLGGFRGTDDKGNTTRIRPDYIGGFRASDDKGNVTNYRSDFLGGFRGTDNNGNTNHIRPDYLGGYRSNR